MSIHNRAFVHPLALVEEGAAIGSDTRVWAFAHILPGAVVGNDCNICDGVFVENNVRIGDRVTIKCGVQLWDGLVLEDDVFVGPNATFTNDAFPRSKQYLEKNSTTLIREGASIGANATILPGLTIGERAMVGAGAVVLHDVPPMAIVVGNPARITGYVATRKVASAPDGRGAHPGALRVGRARLLRLKEVVDLRGTLSVAQLGEGLPFRPERFFLIHHVPSREVRGEHAHRTLREFVVCVHGEVRVVVDDGENRDEIVLDDPAVGLEIGPRIWRSWYGFSEDAVLLALASAPYDSDDYIRDYDEFLRLVRENQDA